MRPLLGTEARHANSVGNELQLARKLASRTLKPGDATAILRAIDDASDWAHTLCGQIGIDDEKPPSPRKRDEISVWTGRR